MAASELKGTTMIIDTADLDPVSSYKLLIGSVLPRAIAWVSTGSTAGVGNIAPVSFFTVVGRLPPHPAPFAKADPGTPMLHSRSRFSRQHCPSTHRNKERI
jgi:hypothetical protein